MKRGKYSKSVARKPIALLLALTMILGVAIGGTLAWLTDSTDAVTNTFTTSDINITLTESENLDLQMVPGHTITKDPKVTVEGGSEAAWLFVKVEESDNFGDFMTYDIADGWTELQAGVYYREVDASANDQEFEVIEGNTVTVLGTVTKGMMEDIIDGTEDEPTLVFTAYAIQLKNGNESNFTAAEAWAEINK